MVQARRKLSKNDSRKAEGAPRFAGRGGEGVARAPIDENSSCVNRLWVRPLNSLPPAPRRQTKAEDVGANGNRYKLFAAHQVGHRRGFVFRTGREMPQGFSVSLVHGHEIPRGSP